MYMDAVVVGMYAMDWLVTVEDILQTLVWTQTFRSYMYILSKFIVSMSFDMMTTGTNAQTQVTVDTVYPPKYARVF